MHEWISQKHAIRNVDVFQDNNIIAMAMDLPFQYTMFSHDTLNVLKPSMGFEGQAEVDYFARVGVFFVACHDYIVFFDVAM